MPELIEPDAPTLKKSDLLAIKNIDQLAKVLFPESKGFKVKAKRGPQNEIIVIIDDLGNELHVHEVKDKPKKSDYTNRGDWSRNERYKFFFQPGKHLLVIGKDVDLSGEIVFRHTRADWSKEGLTRSFVDTLKLLDYGHLAAFDELLERKEVTERFYAEWVEQVRAITKAVTGVPEERRSEVARLVTQRMLFLHFIQAKGLLNHNRLFCLDLMRLNPKNTYHAFKLIFFECLNREGLAKLGYEIPYLNGGLFRPTDLEDEFPDYSIQDQAFHDFLKFLGDGRWHWHLDESSEADSTVGDTLDPALLGHIFEKSVNQKEMGAYYTPTAITRYMSEQGIWGYLGSKLDPPFKPTPNGEDFAAALAKLDKPKLWAFVKDHLASITVLDNACGSGAFLLAGLDVLRAVWTLCRKQLGDSYTPEINRLLAQAGGKNTVGAMGYKFEYSLTRWLISRNIYGVDLEPGAVEIARLRLWLALITHAPDNALGIEPLPNIDYNLRCGNSLMGFTKPKETIAVLEIDCTDLLQDVNLTGIKDGVGPNDWKKGALLQRALLLRGELVNLYRFATQAKVARTLHDVIDTFDERVGEHIEALWERQLQDKLKDKKGNEAATKQWMADYRRLRDNTIRPFHWYLEFPSMMQQGGACVIITNPPWQRVKAERRIFHKQWWPEITNENKYPGVNIEKHYEELYKEFPEAREAWNRYAIFYDLLQAYFKSGRFFHHQDKGDLDLFKLFFEHYLTVLKGDGWLVAIVNGGIYGVDGCKGLRNLYWSKTRWHQMLGFENRWPIFEGVDSRFKVAICICQNGGSTDAVDCFFMKHSPDAPYDETNRVRYSRAILEELSGPAIKFPEVQTQHEVQILQKAAKWPAFTPEGGWNVDWTNESHATNDRHLLTKEKTSVPAYGGAEIYQFDAHFSPPKQYFDPSAWAAHITKKVGPEQWQRPRLAWRRLASNTNERTGIAAILPPGCGCVNTVWVEVVGTLKDDERTVLQGIINSLPFDYLLRRRCATDVTKEVMQSVPLPPPKAFRPFWNDILQAVAKLEKSNDDYGPNRAKLDAIVAQVYGFSESDLEYMWADFRVLGEKEPDYLEKVVGQMTLLGKGAQP